MMDLRNMVEKTLVPHTAFEAAKSRVLQCIELARDATEPVCLALVGESRTGKSRVLKSVLLLYPSSRTETGIKMPILRVTVPARPTVKGLQTAMLMALGDPLFDKGTETSKTQRLFTLMRAVGTQALFVEEFQHFHDKASQKVWHHVADWLKTLVDDTGVALIVAGLPGCLAVINQNEQLSGRFLAPVQMPRLDWRKKADREEFIAILASFEEELSRYFDLMKLSEPEVAFRFYCACGGLMGYLVKLLRQMVWNAISAKEAEDAERLEAGQGPRNVARWKITLSDIARAYLEAVVASSQAAEELRPFSSRFSTAADLAIMESALKIGTPLDAVRQPAGRPIARPLSGSDVLSGR